MLFCSSIWVEYIYIYILLNVNFVETSTERKKCLECLMFSVSFSIIQEQTFITKLSFVKVLFGMSPNNSKSAFLPFSVFVYQCSD